ncbi:3961_t:CDS:2, partial [Gigaspora rosea]
MAYRGKKGMLHLTSTCPVDTSLTLIQNVFTWQEIYNQAAAFASADPNSHTYLLLQAEAKFLLIGNLPSYANLTKTDQIDLFGGLSERFFEQFFGDSLDRNLIVVKSTIASICDSDYCLKKDNPKTQVPVLPESSYFETCFKNWQESHIVPCSAEFKAINEESIPENAFKIDKYTLVETGDVKSTRQIDQRLPLILVINVTGISITDEEIYLENKDLPEEIDFPSNGVNKNKGKENKKKQ